MSRIFQGLAFNRLRGDGGLMSPSIHDLRNDMPDAPPDFLQEMANAGVSLQEARRQYILRLQRQAPRDRLSMMHGGRLSHVSGNTVNLASTVGGRNDLASASGEDFYDLVEAAMAKGMDRQQAVANVARKHPAAHQEFLRATQTTKSGSHMLERKFATME